MGRPRASRTGQPSAVFSSPWDESVKLPLLVYNGPLGPSATRKPGAGKRHVQGGLGSLDRTLLEVGDRALHHGHPSHVAAAGAGLGQGRDELPEKLLVGFVTVGGGVGQVVREQIQGFDLGPHAGGRCQQRLVHAVGGSIPSATCGCMQMNGLRRRRSAAMSSPGSFLPPRGILARGLSD